jgi:dTMP kinase
VLITFEGVEGSGKTTQMIRLERRLKRQAYRVERTAEPDGTPLGVAIRRLFEQVTARPQPLSEVFLFLAARRQHVAEKIGPWLQRRRIVPVDCYTDATPPTRRARSTVTSSASSTCAPREACV